MPSRPAHPHIMLLACYTHRWYALITWFILTHINGIPHIYISNANRPNHPYIMLLACRTHITARLISSPRITHVATRLIPHIYTHIVLTYYHISSHFTYRAHISIHIITFHTLYVHIASITFPIAKFQILITFHYMSQLPHIIHLYTLS